MEQECLETLVGEDTIFLRQNLFDIGPTCLEPADVIFDGESSILKSSRITRDSSWAGESSSSVDSRADKTDRPSLGGQYSKPNIIFFLFNGRMGRSNSCLDAISGINGNVTTMSLTISTDKRIAINCQFITSNRIIKPGLT